MTEQMRDMIAQLMGSSCGEEFGRKPKNPYNHHTACRAYLLGICPYELVPDSRLQGLVSCRKIHEPAHKADYENAQREKDHFYDVDAFEIIENAVKVVDIEIERIKEKLDRDQRAQTDTADQLKQQSLDEIDKQIQEKVEEVESLGNEGKIEESMKASKAVDELRNRRTLVAEQVEIRTGPSNINKLCVCEDCGAQLNAQDHETRIADHYNGKMHIGMVRTREIYEEMKEKIDARRKERKAAGIYDAPPDFDRRRSPRRDDRDRFRGDRDNRGRHDRHERRGGDRDRRDDRERRRSRSRDRRDDRRDDRRRDDRDRRDRGDSRRDRR